MSKKWSRKAYPSKRYAGVAWECFPPAERAVWEKLTAFPMGTAEVARRAKVSESYARQCLHKFSDEGWIAKDVVGGGYYRRYEWYID